ncbi:PAC2 family protein [Nocardioides sp. MJB4]|uniref:PAC2 family protein n=2 Tax=Nocardioides donggukensis TaxID=2774019 RepID=A0A927K3R2_9ACTN|nr:PAC2 family protein [Nocardioides donggukensis]
MLVALHGFLDAGNGAGVAVQHLLEGGLPDDRASGPVVATFDVDVFHDYRARRPAVSFVRDHYESYDAPRLVVRLQRDTLDRPYLLLTGPEPDTRWEGFVRALRGVVDHFGARPLVSLASVPMAVPHSRPITVTQHANDPELMLRTNSWRGELRIPASVTALLELRLGESGHPMTGYVAHVPHYLAQFDHPAAALALLQGVEDSTGLSFDLDPLKVAAQLRDGEVASYLEENPEVAEVVAGLEQQYDAFARAEEEGSSLLAEDEEIPTGDEIGEQFQQFLAGLDEPDGRN